LERKLTAILCADVYGYSRLMGEDEEATLRTLSAYRILIDRLIENHRGRFVNSAGDSALAEFTSVVEAVHCAVEIQDTLKAENQNLPPGRRMEFRIGVNSGDVMVEGEQIYGDGVNVAARLENLADPGGICISGVVHDQVKGKLTLSYQDLGAQQVKNIAEPVRVWRVMLDGHIPSRPAAGRFSAKNYWQKGILSLTGLGIIVSTFLIVQHLSFKPSRTHASIPGPGEPALPLPSMPSIAVLPFTNLSGDPGQEYFSDGLTDLLITRLSKVPGVFVIARTSSFSYKGKAVTVQQVGRELGVRTVLQGSVLRAGGRVRINVQLADAANGANVWARSFDQPLKDIFAVQDETVNGIVTTLSEIFELENLKVPHGGSTAPGTDNVEALDDLLRGAGYYWRLTKQGNEKARGLFEKAVELDPKYADAYAFLGWTYCWPVGNQWSQDPAADLKRADDFAQKALALDDSNLTALTLISCDDVTEGKYDQAAADAERAVALNPNYAMGYLMLGEAQNFEDKPEEGVRTLQKAIRLDPKSQDFYAGDIGVADVFMGRYQEAVPFLERYVTNYPDLLHAHLWLAVAYSGLGRHEEARAEGAEVLRLSPQYKLPTPEEVPMKDARRLFADLRKAGLK
jgi:adenylate cyclase